MMPDRRMGPIAALLLTAAWLLASSALAQDSLPGVDLSPLNEAQRAEAMKIFQENKCNCGCNMTIVDCRTKDPNCSKSPQLAAQVVQLLAQGKPAAEVVKTVFAAPAAAAAAKPGTEYVFDIPVGDSYFVGPKDAPVTLISFLDYQ